MGDGSDGETALTPHQEAELMKIEDDFIETTFQKEIAEIELQNIESFLLNRQKIANRFDLTLKYVN